MTTLSIAPAKRSECGKLCRLLRHEHHAASLRLGLSPHAELVAVLEQSSYAVSCYADQQIIAMGGIIGQLISPIGFVWLALTEHGARRYPVALVRLFRRQLDIVMATRVELATTILGGDEAAKRLAIFLGFHVSHEGPGSAAYTRFGRRVLARHVDGEPDIRVPIGSGYAVVMGYH